MTESEFQQSVIQEANLRGWRVAHFRAMTDRNGRTRTPVAAQGAGFPDLVLAHPRHGVLFVELKTNQGRASSLQREWIDTLRAAGARAFIWRPIHLKAVSRFLAGGVAE